MSKKLAAAFVIFLGISAVALFHSITPYTTPSEIINSPRATGVQVVGRMVDLKYEDGRTVFILTDGKNGVKVIYHGRLDYIDSEIVVVGDWNGSVLVAKEILRKCHTEYGG